MLDVVIGIPSHNEADSISHVTKTIDIGLRKYFPKLKVVIVNSDNDSSDKTKDVFLSTLTIAKKVYLSTGKNSKGKGRNIFKIIKYAKDNNAKAIALFDADVKSIENKWVKLLLSPILKEDGVDLITPLYRRNRMEGNTTNHLIYPYLYAIYGIRIQQPIGGEFALSKKLYVKIMNHKKWESTCLYGIDIMITALALKDKMKIKQQYLGRKIHKPSFPKQRKISSTELDTLFHIFIESKKKKVINKDYDRAINLVDKEIIYPNKDWIIKSHKITKIYIKKNRKTLQNNFKRLNDDFFINDNYKNFITKNVWAEILADAYKQLNNKNISKLKEQISELLLCRIYKFWIDIEDMNSKQVDDEIQEQTKLLKSFLSNP